jgi:hypothetical protein
VGKFSADRSLAIRFEYFSVSQVERTRCPLQRVFSFGGKISANPAGISPCRRAPRFARFPRRSPTRREPRCWLEHAGPKTNARREVHGGCVTWDLRRS